MTAPPMTEVGRATVGGKSMKPTASAVKAGKSTTAMPATTPAAPAVKPSKPTAPTVKPTACPPPKSTASTAKPATAATPPPLAIAEASVTTQSAQTATLVARIPIVFFLMARSPLRSSKALRRSQRSQADLTNITVVVAASFEMAKSKFHKFSAIVAPQQKASWLSKSHQTILYLRQWK